MDQSQLLWLLGLTILALAQAVVLILKLTQDKNNKKKVPNNPSPPVDYHNHEGRLSSCETEIKNLKDINDKDHGLIRDDIRKLTNTLNRKIFSALNGLVKK